MSIKSQNTELVSMNIFRGFAGYGVAICHYIYFFHNIELFQTYSYFFVEFFFILSGYVLYPQLSKVFYNSNLIKIFYYRRWIRTLPTYFLALLIFSIMFNKFDLDTLKLTFLIQNIKTNFLDENYMFIAWSLSIEEYFYLIFPFFLILLNNKFSLKNLCLIFLIFFTLLKLFSIFNYVNSFEDYRTNTVLRLDSIVLGVLARIYIKKINFYKNLLVSFLCLLFFLYFIPNIRDLGSFGHFIFLILIQLFSVTILIVFQNSEKLFVKFQNIGKIVSQQTYSIYLFHMIFLYFLQNYNFNPFFNFTIYFFLIFIFSFFIYRFFEKPLNKLRPEYSETNYK